MFSPQFLSGRSRRVMSSQVVYEGHGSEIGRSQAAGKSFTSGPHENRLGETRK